MLNIQTESSERERERKKEKEGENYVLKKNIFFVIFDV